jgi:hypothetical protein
MREKTRLKHEESLLTRVLRKCYSRTPNGSLYGEDAWCGVVRCGVVCVYVCAVRLRDEKLCVGVCGCVWLCSFHGDWEKKES